MTQLSLLQAPDLPVNIYLREQRDQALAVMREGVPRAKAAAGLSQPEWEQLGEALLAAMASFVQAMTGLRELPATTACVCPLCNAVTLPPGPYLDQYSHCGRLWFVQGRKGYVALASDFWLTTRPGEAYLGAIAASWAESEDEDETPKKKATPKRRKSA